MRTRIFSAAAVMLLAGASIAVAHAQDLPDLVIDNAVCHDAWATADGMVTDAAKEAWAVFEKNGILYPGNQCENCPRDERDLQRVREEANETYITCDITVSNKGAAAVPDGHQGYFTMRLGDIAVFSPAFLLPQLKPGESVTASETFQYAYFAYGKQGVNSLPLQIEVNRYSEWTSDPVSAYIARFYSGMRSFYGVSQEGTNNPVVESDHSNNFFTSTVTLPFVNRPDPVDVDSIKVVRAGDEVRVSWAPSANADKYRILVLRGSGEVEGRLSIMDVPEPGFTLAGIPDGQNLTLTIYGMNTYGSAVPVNKSYFPMSDKPFSDVQSGSWYDDFVTELFSRKLVEGYKDGQGNPTGRFGPGDNVTVAELGQVYVRMRGIPLSDDVSNVPEQYRNHWSAKIMSWMIRQNFWIVQYDKSPDRPATREEVVRFILENQYDLIPGRDFFATHAAKNMLTYTLPDIDTENKFYTQMAYDFGIIDGYPDGYFRPKNLVNRAEVAKILLQAGKRQLR